MVIFLQNFIPRGFYFLELQSKARAEFIFIGNAQ